MPSFDNSSTPTTKVSFYSNILGNYACQEPSCNLRTRQLLLNGKCNNPACKGKVTAEHPERKTNDTLRYLSGLFNVPSFCIENNLPPKSDVPFEHEFNQLHELVERVLSQSQYNKVDLGSLFSFMCKM